MFLSNLILNLSLAILQYSSEISDNKKFLLFLNAIIPVVPEPAKQSRITSPGLDQDKI